MSNARMTRDEYHKMPAQSKRRSVRAVAEREFAQRAGLVPQAQEGAATKPAASAIASESQKVRKAKRKSNAPLTATFCAVQPKEGEVVFVLPLPPKKLSPNGRGLHWRSKAAAVKAYRQQCALLMSQSPQQPFAGRVVVDLEFYLCRLANDRTSYYPKDEDNARGSAKQMQDALKDAGIIPGDGKKFVRVGKTTLYSRAKEHKGFTCVVMTIRKEVD